MNGRHIVIGILAHVDAGKTTLSESLLYLAGSIRKQGRVDHGDAFLDTWQLEKDRGITIFSKQAELSIGGRDGLSVTLLDTPGHIDFSPETERTLQVLDYAILIISAPDGVTGQVRNLWRLLASYKVPVFLFVNKMDQSGADAGKVLEDIHKNLSGACVDFSNCRFSPSLKIPEDQMENIAVCDDAVLEHYLETQTLQEDEIRAMIGDRRLFPVFFGAALKNEGVDRLMEGLNALTITKTWPEEFGARVFKISRDTDGSRLTWMRITGGSLKVRSTLPENAGGEKVNQIRVYSGDHFTQLAQADAGCICAVTGPEKTRIGMGLGFEKDAGDFLLQPVLKSQIILTPDQDRSAALRNLQVLSEEEPLLHIDADSPDGDISVRIMGQVQMEILKSLCDQRFHMPIRFAPPSVLYKETIAEPVEGVGHFEPLRHYAEVHLLLKPDEPGSGLHFETDCRSDELSLNWQRLILSSLESQMHRGVLTGSEITDMKIIVTGGRASEKHTVGGDFRQAACRAVRQGLMMAKNVLLEPVYRYQAELPSGMMGRFMTDLQRMEGTADLEENDGTTALITGTVPAAALQDYQQEMYSYTHGQGRLTLSLKGYEPCRHAEEVILQKGYDPDADLENPSSSVFCSHGAGIQVPWNLVRSYMHVDTGWRPDDPWQNGQAAQEAAVPAPGDRYPSGKPGQSFSSGWQKEQKTGTKSWAEEQQLREAEEKDLQQIFDNTYTGSSWQTPLHHHAPAWSNDSGIWSRDGSLEKAEAEKPQQKDSMKTPPAKPPRKKEEYLLVDGYNMIFNWEELRKLAAVNMDAARDRLIEILSNFHGTRPGTLILVFDAYKVHGGRGEVYPYHNIYVVFTKEAETADAYIEKTVHRIGHQGNVTVATSDGLEQIIIFGDGARRMSARELLLEIESSQAELRSRYKI